MAGQSSGKKKLLLIAEYLLKYSDEEHPVTTGDIIGMLEKNAVSCERKSVYSDIEALSDFGIDIVKTKQGRGGWFVASRQFEEVEIRLLIDAVQSASFITPAKSKKLIKNISTLCSREQMKKLSSRVYIDNRVKSDNETIYYSIDEIGKAIDSGKQIECDYAKCRTVSKLKNSACIEKHLILNPYAMIWSADHYYLVANNPKYENLMHLRIDRMKNVKAIESSTVRHFSQVSDYTDYFDIADYSKRIFNMFSGETEDIELHCKIDILEQIIDRFGSDAPLREDFDNEDMFFVRTKAAISDGLISWMMQFEDKLEVISPDTLRAEIKAKAQKISELY